MTKSKKPIQTDKDTNLVDFQLKIKGVGKLTINFDARAKIEKLFNKVVDIAIDELVGESHE